MFEIVMLLGFVYAAFSQLLPEPVPVKVRK
jgi:hypothetical protein